MTSFRADAVPPEPGLEQELAAVWSEILDVDVMDRKADFFDLGGHSLLAMRSVDRISQRFGASISMVEFFANPCLYQQSALLEQRVSNSAPLEILTSQVQHAESPLSFTQERLWVLGQLDEASVAYNIVGGVQITGDLDIECMNIALRDVVTRQQVMRAYYVMTDDGLRQRFYDHVDGLSIEEVDFSDQSPEEAEAAAAEHIRRNQPRGIRSCLLPTFSDRGDQDRAAASEGGRCFSPHHL